MCPCPCLCLDLAWGLAALGHAARAPNPPPSHLTHAPGAPSLFSFLPFLQELRSQADGRPLADLAAEGLASPLPGGPGAALDSLVKELLAVQQGGTAPRVLLAVDSYNSLYWRTEYREAVHTFHHRQLAPEELRLVRGAGKGLHHRQLGAGGAAPGMGA